MEVQIDVKAFADAASGLYPAWFRLWSPPTNRIDRKLWGRLPSTPLFQRPTFIALRAILRNVADNPSGEGLLWHAEA